MIFMQNGYFTSYCITNISKCNARAIKSCRTAVLNFLTHTASRTVYLSTKTRENFKKICLKAAKLENYL